MRATFKTPLRRARDHVFFVPASLALLAFVVAGFLNSYLLGGMLFAPLPSILVHVHAALFVGWSVLLVGQIALAASGHLRLHRRLGGGEAGPTPLFPPGRRRRGAVAEVAHGVAVRAGVVRLLPGPRDPALRRARVCYDHLAGELGVALYDGLLRGKSLRRRGAALALTAGGRAWFDRLGIDTAGLARQRRMLCRPCLDWSERRSHLAGGLGRALLERIESLGWARRAETSRIVTVTPAGERALKKLFA